MARVLKFAMSRAQKAQLQEIPTPWGKLVGVKVDRIARTIIADGQYEWAETAIVAQLLRAGATAIDVGANIGYYTALFRCLVGHQGSVHAFEANPFTAALLKLSMARNGWDDVTINAVAIGDAAGNLQVRPMDLDLALADASLNLGGWSLQEAAAGEWQIPVVPLDQYVRDNHIEKLHFLKVDVEGFELKVLDGADTVIRKLRPYIMMEMRATDLTDRVRCEQMVERLEQGGYICCRIIKRPFPHFRVLARADTETATFHFNLLAMPAARYREFFASIAGRILEPESAS